MSEGKAVIPRRSRTPKNEALRILESVFDAWMTGTVDFEQEEEELKATLEDAAEIFWGMVDSIFDIDGLDPEWEYTPEELASEFVEVDGAGLDNSDVKNPITPPQNFLQLIFVVIYFCTKAFNESKKNDVAGWSYIADGSYWLGIVHAVENGLHIEQEESSNAAAQLAKKRHKETYQLKSEAIEYWEKNIDAKLSAQKAANELVAVVPVSHRTLAAWVSKAKKSIK